jgi:uncharacterized coiled-coil protein SlyX
VAEAIVNDAQEDLVGMNSMIGKQRIAIQKQEAQIDFLRREMLNAVFSSKDEEDDDITTLKRPLQESP